MFSRTLAGALAAGLLLAACGGSSTPKTASSGGGGKTVAVAADPGGALMFTTTKLTAPAGKVTFDFTNQAKIPHAFEIQGHGTDAKTATVTGGTASVTVKDLKPGTYTFFCPVPGHRAAGMEGTLTVK
jgi:plastocyanin